MTRGDFARDLISDRHSPRITCEISIFELSVIRQRPIKAHVVKIFGRRNCFERRKNPNRQPGMFRISFTQKLQEGSQASFIKILVTQQHKNAAGVFSAIYEDLYRRSVRDDRVSEPLVTRRFLLLCRNGRYYK